MFVLVKAMVVQQMAQLALDLLQGLVPIGAEHVQMEFVPVLEMAALQMESHLLALLDILDHPHQKLKLPGNKHVKKEFVLVRELVVLQMANKCLMGHQASDMMRVVHLRAFGTHPTQHLQEELKAEIQAARILTFLGNNTALMVSVPVQERDVLQMEHPHLIPLNLQVPLGRYPV